MSAYVWIEKLACSLGVCCMICWSSFTSFSYVLYVESGNADNCGTWMDKMGESWRASNHGTPATPRDGLSSILILLRFIQDTIMHLLLGVDIEIIGLLKSCLRWINALHENGQYTNSFVVVGKNEQLSFVEWERRLASSFEHHFWIPLDEAQDCLFLIDKSLVHRRGIYKVSL